MGNNKEYNEASNSGKAMSKQLPDVKTQTKNEVAFINEGSEHSGQKQPQADHTIHIKLSKSLFSKLKHKSQIEGISLEDLSSELLAEGLVLRAWEIMERKSTMRNNSNGNGNNYSNNRSQHKQTYRNNNSNNNYRGRSSSHSHGHYNGQNGSGRRGNYQHILEDNANFLEYVRNQEKKNT